MSDQKTISKAGLFHLAVVYFVWGSTYLAIRIGVRSGSGFPPFTFAGLRVLTAGILLLLIGKLRGRSILPTGRDVGILAASGFLLWIGGNGLVTWAETQVDSAIAALIVAAVPIWVAGMEAQLDRRIPGARMIISLLVGFAGILVLSMPVLRSGVRADLVSVLALFLASLSWGGGLVLQARQPVSVSRGVSSGYQQIFGGIFFALLVILVGEPQPTPQPQAWAAWGYLVVFGSVFAFTSFISALQLLPTHLVVTYAYVNPVIAVFLGWLLLSEPITLWTAAGALLVFLGVAGVYRGERHLQRSRRNE